MMAIDVLVIDQDSAVRGLLERSESSHAFRFREAGSAETGLAMASQTHPNLILAETSLPDMPGEELIRLIRAWSDVPIIALSESAEEGQVVRSLEAGANDHVAKPFGVPELVARMKVVLRHAKAAPNRTARLQVDFARKEVRLAGGKIRLTPVEFRIAALLVRSESRVVTHQALMREASGVRGSVDRHCLRVYIGYLRRKLMRETGGMIRILNVPRVGYRLVLSDDK